MWVGGTVGCGRGLLDLDLVIYPVLKTPLTLYNLYNQRTVLCIPFSNYISLTRMPRFLLTCSPSIYPENAAFQNRMFAYLLLAPPLYCTPHFRRLLSNEQRTPSPFHPLTKCYKQLLSSISFLCCSVVYKSDRLFINTKCLSNPFILTSVSPN